MTNNTIASKVEKCLKNQAKTVDQIYALQKSAYNSVIERDWLESEKSIRKLNTLSSKFMDMDKDLYDMINSEQQEEADFFNFTRTLPEQDKNNLNELYNKLKKKLVNSKIENDSFSNYITHAQSLVQGMVDIITEDRNGKCYTHTGQRVSVDLSNIVLDKTF